MRMREIVPAGVQALGAGSLVFQCLARLVTVGERAWRSSIGATKGRAWLDAWRTHPLAHRRRALALVLLTAVATHVAALVTAGEVHSWLQFVLPGAAAMAGVGLAVVPAADRTEPR
jgi:hypothetical protein